MLILRRLALTALPLLLAVFSPAVADAGPILSAPFVTAGAGATVTIPIEITGATELTSWQFDLAFDPLIVSATLVTEGPFMSAFGTTFFGPGVIDNLNGLISLVSASYVDFPPNPSGSGTLAFVEFQALAMGVSPLQFSNVFLNFSDQDFTVSHGAITISNSPAVPVPEQQSTLALLALGLALLHGRGLAVSRRRMQRRSIPSGRHQRHSRSNSDSRREMMLPKRLVGAIAITALFGAFNADPATAQTTAPGPYYASPSWDQTLPVNSRFIILSNMNSEAFLDRETGLVWARANIVYTAKTILFIQHDQSTARFLCSDLAAGNRKGWRLPLADELLTLANPTGPSAAPLITTLGPSGKHTYWTNEFVSHDSVRTIDFYRFVDLETGDMANDGSEGFRHLALCVRGRQ